MTPTNDVKFRLLGAMVDFFVIMKFVHYNNDCNPASATSMRSTGNVFQSLIVLANVAKNKIFLLVGVSLSEPHTSR